jgi:hypothetical protein
MEDIKITNGDREWVNHPGLTLEDVEADLFTNECSGRGSDTAAPRGYNVERVAAGIFDSYGRFHRYRSEPWIDTIEWANDTELRIESKACIHRYPSGGYGQFRIWQSHHYSLTNIPDSLPEHKRLYFFLVYTVKGDEDGDATEIGKMAVEAEIIDELIADWRWIDHETKGFEQVRDISWHLLLSRLGVSVEQFRDDDIIIVTNESTE